MKHVLLILDGASDAPVPVLGGRTPLQAARTPALDALAAGGRLGRVRSAVPGLPVDSLVCILGLLGYDPVRYAPAGRAAFEALGRGIALGPDDLALRCNLVSVTPDGALADSTGGMPTDAEVKRMLDALMPALAEVSLDAGGGWELHPGQSYRNLLVIRGAGCAAADLACAEPHMRLGESVQELMPCGKCQETAKAAEALALFMEKSRQILAPSGHMAWLWSPATVTELSPFHFPPFCSESGKSCVKNGGAVIAALDFMRGLARSAGLVPFDVPGASGGLDTDYGAKGAAAIRALDDFDFVLIHVNAADEAAHQRDPWTKVKALEAADARLVRPLVEALRARHGGAFRIAVCADHATLCASGGHGDAPPPFLVYDDKEPCCTLTEASCTRFTEDAVSLYAPVPALSFLSHFADFGRGQGEGKG